MVAGGNHKGPLMAKVEVKVEVREQVPVAVRVVVETGKLVCDL